MSTSEKLLVGAYYPLSDERLRWGRDHRIQATAEFRPPRKGEWYLSGAITEGYRALSDLRVPYRIGVLVKLIRTEIVTITPVEVD